MADTYLFEKFISKSRVTKGFIGYCVTPTEIGPSQDCTSFGTFCSLVPVGMKRSFCYHHIIKVCSLSFPKT